MTERNSQKPAHSIRPQWATDQITKGFGIEAGRGIQDTQDALDQLSLDRLVDFFVKNNSVDLLDKKNTVGNGAAHIFAYQKGLNILLGTNLVLDGIFKNGGETSRAIKRFQIETNIQPANGQPNRKTTQELLAILEIRANKEKIIRVNHIVTELKKPNPLSGKKGIDSYYSGQNANTIDYAFIYQKPVQDNSGKIIDSEEYYAFDKPIQPGGPRDVYRVAKDFRVIGSCRINPDGRVIASWGKPMNAVPYMPPLPH